MTERCLAVSGGHRCRNDAGHPPPHNYDHDTPPMGAKEAAILELEAATIALRDAALAGKAAQARYQAALQAFNRAVAPDPDAK